MGSMRIACQSVFNAKRLPKNKQRSVAGMLQEGLACLQRQRLI